MVKILNKLLVKIALNMAKIDSFFRKKGSAKTSHFSKFSEYLLKVSFSASLKKPNLIFHLGRETGSLAQGGSTPPSR